MRSGTKRWASVATALGLAAGAVLVSGAPAMASGAACNPGCTAYVEFASKGEIFTIHDYSADGHPTVGLMEQYDGPDNGWDFVESVEDHNGYAGAPVSLNMNFPEGRKLRYRACLGTYENHWSCSDYRTDTA